MSDSPRGGPRGSRGGGPKGRGGRGGEATRGGRGDLPYRPSNRGDRGSGDGNRASSRGGGSRGGTRGGSRGPPGRGDGPRHEGTNIFRSGQNVPTPNAQVRKVEDGMAKALTVFKKTADAEAYPDRPGYGTKGVPTTLYANCLPMTLSRKVIYRYNVEIKGDGGKDAPTGKMARQIVRLLLEEHFSTFLKSIATDYRSTIVSCVEIPLTPDEGEKKKKSFNVRYKGEDEDEYPEGPRIFKVTCEPTGTLNPLDLTNYLASCDATASLANKEELVQALNLIMGHRPKTDRSVINIGGNKHYSVQPDTMESWSLGSGLAAIRGFFVSARAATARMVLNVQVKYCVTYQAGPLKILIDSYQGRDRSLNAFKLDKFLRRLRIRLTHLPRRSSNGKTTLRVKTISSLASTGDAHGNKNVKVARTGCGPLDVQFWIEGSATVKPAPAVPGAEPATPGKKGKKGAKAAGPAPAGKWVTVGQYFKERYNIDSNPNYPVINTGTRQNPSYVPVEACVVEPGQTFGSKVGPFQTREMLSFSVGGRKPGQNAHSIVTKGVNLLGLDGTNQTLAAFGVTVGTELLTVNARVLPCPAIQYANDKEIRPTFGGWNMVNIAFTKPSNIAAWTYLDITDGRPNFDSNENEKYRTKTLQAFVGQLKKMGVDMHSPPVMGQVVSLTDNRDENFKAIEDAVRKVQEKHRNLGLVLGILPNDKSATYNIIKQVCDVRCGVTNVNVQASKFRFNEGKSAQYFANVGLKINLKSGGVNQSLRTSELGIFGDGKTMLVGLDVTHPSPGSAGNAPSVAAIVASIDASLGQWPAQICIQKKPRNEMVEDLKIMMKSRLSLWAKNNRGQYPEKIVVYRDGVSEGQYGVVVDKELPLLKEACREVYPADLTKRNFPRMSIIIVGKRHNMRFYPSDTNADRSGNPKAGTVVDRGVSESRAWDFYLQAHTALQGTARPAHYFTVWDEIFHTKQPAKGAVPTGLNPADTLQDLTHKMCYMFGRATKAVSVCPPAYYADLVCTRARCYLADLFDPDNTPEASVMSGETNKTIDGAQTRVNARVADTMFYI